MYKRALLIVVIVATLVAGLIVSQHRSEVPRVSGFVEADEIRVGSRVGGRVKRVAVSEGQAVRRGDVLLELEPFDLLELRSEAAAELARRRAELERFEAGYRPEEIAQAKARVDQLQAALVKLEHGPRRQEIASAEAELRLARAQLELATLDHARARELLAEDAASRQSFDHAASALEVARETVRVREEALALLREGTREEEITEARARLAEAEQAWKLQCSGFRKEDIAAARAAVESADAALRAIDRRLSELQVASPVDGTIEAVELQPGDLVVANAPAISIMDTASLWVRAYVPENRLDLAIGLEVDVEIDSFPGRRFSGRVSFVARQAEFTPGNVQTPEERSKQVFRVKVELTEGLDVLRPGMEADVLIGKADPPR